MSNCGDSGRARERERGRSRELGRVGGRVRDGVNNR